MKIRLRWLLSGVLALAVGVVVAGYAILATMDFADLRAVIEAEAKSATGRNLTIAGPLDLKVSLTPAIAIENVTFGNAPWGSRPEMLSIRRLEVEVRLLPLLSGNIEVRRLVLIEPTILLETSPRGEGNWEIAAAADAAPAAATEGAEEERPGTLPAFHRIEVRDGRLLYRDGASGQETQVELKSLEARADTPASPSEVALAGRFRGIDIDARGTLGSRDQLLGGGRFPLDLTVTAAGARLHLAGELGDLAAGRGIDMKTELSGARLSDLDALAGATLPALGPYELATRLSDGAEGYKLSGLTLRLGGSDLAGNATLSLAAARPKISGTLHGELIDLDDFAAPAAPAPEPEQAFVFGDRPLPLTHLKVIDARVKLSAEQFKFDDRTMLSKVSLAVDLKNGRLKLSDLAGDFSGGRFTGELALDGAADPPLMSADLKAEGFDYGHFLQGRDVTDGVAGRLDGGAWLAASGSSPRAWAASLDGRIEIVGGEGWVRSDLLRTGGAGLIDVVAAWREGEDDLRLNCVVMRLPIASGVVTSEAILIDTDAVTVGVTGQADLRAETLDFKATPQAKRTSLLSLMVPVRIGGTLAAPSYAPDAVGTVVGVAKIAGMIINPLIAGAAIVLDSELAAKNPCLGALQQAKTPPATGASRPPPPAGEGGLEGVVKGVGEGIGQGLKSLFGQ